LASLFVLSNSFLPPLIEIGPVDEISGAEKKDYSPKNS